MPDLMFNVTSSKSWPDFQSMMEPIFLEDVSTTARTTTFATSTAYLSSSGPINFIGDDQSEVNDPDLSPSKNWEFYGFLSLLFPFGLAIYRSGLAHRKNCTVILISPFIHMTVGCLVYWLIGYGFANESSDSGFIGTKLFVPRSHLYDDGYNISLNNWFSQYCVVVSCNAIAGSGLPESSYLLNQVLLSFLVSGFAFPVVAHWTHFPEGWLQVQRFTDFAGAGVLHIVGGSCAFVLIILGRVKRVAVVQEERTVNVAKRYMSATSKDLTKFFTSIEDVLETSKVLTVGHNPVLSILGAVLSLIGFFALQLVFKDFDQYVDRSLNPNLPIESISAIIITNSFLSASAGGLTACLLARVITHQWSVYRLFGGAVAGLVCTSSGLNIYLSWASLILGFSGGLFYVLIRNAVLKLKCIDPVESISIYFVPGLLSVLARGVAAGSFAKDPKIFLWYWAGISAIFAWAASIVLVIFGPIAIYFTTSLFVQEAEDQANGGLDKVCMREIVISHFCNPVIIDPSNFAKQKKSQSRELEVFKPRLVTDNPKTPVLTTRPSQTSPPNFFSKSQVDLSPDHHPEITSPILVSTTATLSPNLLQNIDVLRKQKAEKIRAEAFERRKSESEKVSQTKSCESVFSQSNTSTPKSLREPRTPVQSRTLPTTEILSNFNKSRQETLRRTGNHQVNPQELLRIRLLREQTNPVTDNRPEGETTPNKSRQKIILVDDGFTSDDSDTNNNTPRI